MRIDKKMARYVEKNGHVIKNYNSMCEILGEKSTSGEAKEIQLKRWRLYFDFEKKDDGHKFIIKQIYDDKAVKENEEVYSETKKIIGNSKYRKNLLQIILYLLITSKKNFIMVGKTSFAAKCGFFNQNAIYYCQYEKYKNFRNIIMKRNSDKNYFKATMKKSSFKELMKGIKKNSKDVIESLLLKMQEAGWIYFKQYHFGYKEHGYNILSDNEIEIYNECEKEALNKVSTFYNLTQKRKKAKIELSDFIYESDKANKYYKILDSIVLEKLGYSNIFDRYVIWGTPIERIEKRCTIKTEDEYKKAISIINKIFLNTMKENSDNKIKNKATKKIEFDKLENDIKDGYIYDEEEIEYYNRLELLDLLVNTETPIDAIDIEAYVNEEANRTLMDAHLVNALKIHEDKITIG